MDRRKFIIRSIGAAICAGLAPRFLPSLLPEAPLLRGAGVRFITYEGVPPIVSPDLSSRTFHEMLSKYFTDELLQEEILNRDYLLNKITKFNLGFNAIPIRIPDIFYETSPQSPS